MDLRKYLFGDGKKDKGVVGKIAQEEWRLMSLAKRDQRGQYFHKIAMVFKAYNTIFSLMRVWLDVTKLFGFNIPNEIGREIKRAIEDLCGAATEYIDNPVSSMRIRTAVKLGRCAAVEFRKAIKARRVKEAYGEI